MDNEILFKICKTCNESKEISKYRVSAKECKQCNNKKDYLNSLLRKKEHYKRNRDRIIKHNLDYYYKIKELNKPINEVILCG